jgi:hypothetical protein
VSEALFFSVGLGKSNFLVKHLNPRDV